MVYTRKGPFTSGSATPPINGAFLNGLEAQLLLLNGVYLAPAPSGDTSGATDQANLQPLLTTAQANNGRLWLQPGTYYVTGLVTSQAFVQPRIVGAGRDQTTLVGVSGASQPALKFKGGSGAAAGGGIDDVFIQNSGGIGVQIADANGLTCYRLLFDGCSTGVNFYNEGGFTEFNVIRDSMFRQNCLTAVRYSRSNSTESFHGSGIDGNTVIDQLSGGTNASIVVEAGCLPYQSPLTFRVFTRNNTAIIQNNNNGGLRAPQFFGCIGVENTITNAVLGGGYRIHYDGNIQAFAKTGFNNGTIVLTEQTYYNDNGVYVRRRPWVQGSSNIGSSPSIVCGLESGIGHMIEVNLSAPNYFYRYKLYVSQSPIDGTGQVSVESVHGISNGAGYGGVTTWTVSNYQLYASGSSFPANASSPINATSKLTAVGELNLMP